MREQKMIEKIFDLTKSGKIAWVPERSERQGGDLCWVATLMTKGHVKFHLVIDECTPRTLHITIKGNMIFYGSVVKPFVKELTDYVCSGQQRFKKKNLELLGRYLNTL